MRVLKKKKSERGVALAEFAILVPLLLTLLVGVIDIGRMIYAQQILSDLSRETGNLVSRGTSINAAVSAVINTSELFDVDSDGVVIISRVRRRDTDDSQPWVFEQVSTGALTSTSSKVGTLGGPAVVPGLDEVPEGVTIMAVELVQSFAPLFPVKKFGLDFYPETIYQPAFF